MLPHAHMRTHARTHTYTPTRIPARTYAHKHSYMHARMHTHTCNKHAKILCRLRLQPLPYLPLNTRMLSSKILTPLSTLRLALP